MKCVNKKSKKNHIDKIIRVLRASTGLPLKVKNVATVVTQL